MAQHIPHPITGNATYFTREEWRQQGELFSLLPRQLPVYKAGPEDDFLGRQFTPHHPSSLH